MTATGADGDLGRLDDCLLYVGTGDGVYAYELRDVEVEAVGPVHGNVRVVAAAPPP